MAATSPLKSLAWLAVGGLGGAVGAAWLLDGDDGSARAGGPASLVETVAGFALGREGGQGTGADVGVAERLDAYREAQQESDIESLTRALERAAGRTWSPARDLEIDALLGRIAELAPDYAAALAVSLRLDAPFVAQAWLAWADANADAALEGLARIASPALRRDVALALTDVLGDDARGIERIAAALAPADGNALRVAVLAERAAADPFGAFREAMALGDPALARQALDQVAIAWAAEDPYGALAQADLLAADLAQNFRAKVLNEWARVDAEGYVAYLGSQSPLPQEATAGIQYLLAVNPELVEQVAGNFEGTLGLSVRAAALSALAARDPDAARAQAESLPPGQQRDLAVQAVASALAQTDPDAAIAWVRGLSPPAPSAMQSVMLALAQTDIVRAIELLDDPAMAAQSQLLLSIATSMGIADPAQTPALAERLLAREDLQSQSALRNLVGNWMQRDPETALEWVLERGTEIDATVLASAAQMLAARDPLGAADYVERIPPAQRGVWITQVASQYGRYDPQSAMNWVSQFQGQEFYDVAVRQLVVNAAQTDARTAAQLLSQSSPTVQLGGAQQVASALAQQDPSGALRWAETLTDPRARTGAVGTALSAWASSDLDAASNWALVRPPGEDRDRLLATLVSRAGVNGQFDRELLAGFSVDSLRDQAAATAILQIARGNAAQARALVASEIDNPAERARIEAQIAALTTR